ncbi:MAG: hypothetical protein AAF533_23350 [Acidobacteriota bacterium]
MSRREEGVLFPEGCRQFQLESDEEFAAKTREEIAALRELEDFDSVKERYEETVAWRETERVRRTAVARLRAGEPKLDLMFVPVGIGPQPAARAVLATPAEKYVLLHTDRDKGGDIGAKKLEEMLGLAGSEVDFKDIGSGRNPLDIYQALKRTWETEHQPENVGVDITGGLATMTSSMALAASTLPRCRVFYMAFEELELHRYRYFIDIERHELPDPLTVFGERERARAQELFQTGQHEAAGELYRRLRQGRQEDGLREDLARAYGLLESMDFGRAAKKLENLCESLERVHEQVPELRGDQLVDKRHLVRLNAEGARRLSCIVGRKTEYDPLHEGQSLAQDELLDFIEHLLAKSSRRMANADYDVAALLAYRALEATIQRRLALRAGITANDLDWSRLISMCELDLDALLQAQARVASRPEFALDQKALPTSAGSSLAYTILAAAFPDDLAKPRPDKHEEFVHASTARNRSVLAHGLRKTESNAADKLLKTARHYFHRLCEIEGVSVDEREELKDRHELIVLEG